MRGRRLSFGIVSALAAATMMLAPTTATAQYQGGGRGAWHDHGGGYARGGFYGGGYDEARGDPRGGDPRGGDPRGGDPRGGDSRGEYRDRRGYPRGYDRHRCRNGAGGTILGAIAGGLLGDAVSGRGDRTAGTIIGGGVGALAGSAIGRDC